MYNYLTRFSMNAFVRLHYFVSHLIWVMPWWQKKSIVGEKYTARVHVAHSFAY